MSSMETKDLRCIRWPLSNPDCGMLKATLLCWREAEPSDGQFDFSVVHKAIDLAWKINRTVMLRIDAKPPLWSENLVPDFICFLRALGSDFDPSLLLFSIDIVMPEKDEYPEHAEEQLKDEEMRLLAEAYMEAFPHTYKLLDVRNNRLAALMKGKTGIGLVLDARKQSSDIGDQLARLGLQRVWETAPVRMMAENLSEALLNEAVRWHVSSLDLVGEYDETWLARIGYRLELRRVGFVESARALQTVPLSVWMVNSGNAPCYNDSRIFLRLARADVDVELTVGTSFTARNFFPGEDNLLSEDIPLSDLPHGVYDVELGLFEEGTGFQISLAIEGRISDGFYAALLQMTIEA